MSEWTWRQIRDRERIQKTFRHVITKGSHPSKDWWVPPVGLRQTLMLSLRYLGVSVSLTMDDHHQEVIAYCRWVAPIFRFPLLSVFVVEFACIG